MEVTRVDALGLDSATAGAMADVENAALADVPLRRHTAETFRLEVADRDGQGPDEGVWLAHEDGELVGWCALTLNRHENLDGAKILGAVRPDRQRRGIGRALLAAAEAATDRPRLRVPAWAGTPGEVAVPALGYGRTDSHEVRRLELHDPQPASLVTAAEEASADYDVEHLPGGACPEHLLGDLQVLREVINDAPGGGADFERYPPERLRAEEESLARQHKSAYTVLARHRASGEPAGLSYVVVHELRPEIAAQEDTSVVGAHRGHRLGLRLKLAMLDRLRSERPDVVSIDTWNAPDNAPMIAVNEALGCRLVAEAIRFVKAR